MKRRCERCIQQKERHQMAIDKQRQEEDEQYRNEVEEEVMSRMEYLRAEGERLRAEYEESLRILEEEERKAEEERLKAEEEMRMKAEQQRQEEERLRMEQEQLRIEEEQKQQKEEQELAERLAAAEWLVEFAEQIKEQETQTEPPVTKEVCLQTENSADSIDLLKKENEALRKQVQEERFSVNIIQGNDQMTKFYTGLPTWGVFLHIFCFLSPYVTPSSRLCLEDELFMVLVRLRLGLFLQDIASRFRISPSIVSRIFQKWLDVMCARLTFLISWPVREINQQNMPPVFKQLYPNCRCIIDCSEIFIETPKNFDARSKTYSNYKKHNTIKFLIGITPVGTISFLSQCWGGRVSDKNLTQESDFFNLVEAGDTVLADRGFTIADDLAVHGVKLEIPAFTRGKGQLSQRDVELSKQLSKVRIHVERVIGNLKNKYTILKGPLPVNLLKHKHDNGTANIDKIVAVCASLTNLCESIV